MPNSWQKCKAHAKNAELQSKTMSLRQKMPILKKETSLTIFQIILKTMVKICLSSICKFVTLIYYVILTNRSAIRANKHKHDTNKQHGTNKAWLFSVSSAILSVAQHFRSENIIFG